MGMSNPSIDIRNIVKKAKQYETELLYETAIKIKGLFTTFFNSFDYNNLNASSNGVSLYKIINFPDLDQLYTGAGFYVIVTNCKFSENQCTLLLKGKYKAIYRGHSASLRRRIESHLFNKAYSDGYEKRKKEKGYSEMPFTACMKIENGINGINVDELPYSDFTWYVIQHKMPGSSEPIRKQAEAAFDAIFNKPFANRDR